MKIKKIIKCGMILVLFYSTSISARGRWSSTGGGAKKASSLSRSSVTSTPSQTRGVEIIPTESNKCSPDGYVSRFLLEKLFLDASLFEFKYDEAEQKVKVEIPPYYGDCLELDFEFKLESNQLMVMAKNSKRSLEGKGSTFEKYTQCLKKKKPSLLSLDDNGGYVHNKDKAKISNGRYFELDVNDDREFNPSKNLNVVFLSPTPSNENGYFPDAFGKSSKYDQCWKKENISEDGVYIAHYSSESKIKKTVLEACLSNNYDQIISVMQKHYDAYGDVLEKAHMKSLDERAQKIYAELGSIGDEFKMTDGKPSLDYQDAQDQAYQYAEVLERLNEKVLDPYISRVEDLLKKRKGPPTLSKKGRKKIDGLIKEYNMKIQEYARGYEKFGYASIMDVLKYHGHTDVASKMKIFRLKSVAYGRVYKKGKGGADVRGKQLRFTEAEEFIKHKMKKFSRVLKEWSEEASSRRGDTSPAKRKAKLYKKLERNREKAWRRDNKRIQEKYKKCIGWYQTQFKVQKCQRKAQASRKRAIDRRGAYNSRLGEAADSYERYWENFLEYRRTASVSSGGDSLDDPLGYDSEYNFANGNVSPEQYYSLGVPSLNGGNVNGNMPFNQYIRPQQQWQQQPYQQYGLPPNNIYMQQQGPMGPFGRSPYYY